jgi:7-cyano-7-deazaguanine synthase
MKEDGYRPRALTFEYRGMAASELRAARRLARSAGAAEHRRVRLPDVREAGEIWRFKLGRLPPTYIPMRNAIFYSVAAGYAEEVGARCIVGGHNRDDLRTFRDAGGRFFKALEGAFWSGSARLEKGRVKIIRPLEGMTKSEVIRLAVALGVPLRLTWSCHRDGARHCWKCPGCVSRTEAFRKAGVADPLRVRPHAGKTP